MRVYRDMKLRQANMKLGARISRTLEILLITLALNL